MQSRVVRTALAAVCAATAVLTGLFATAGAADAAPRELPRITTTGDTFGTFGNHSYCRGAVRVSLTSPTPGITRVTLISHGFHGQGQTWVKNPRCRVLFIATHTSATAYLKETFIPATFGPRSGQKVSRDIRTGSGVVQFGVAPYAPNTAVRTPQGYGAGYYILVP
ncbi:enoyl-CoA hydratase [Gordonia sp. CPCC 205515]|uniref:enoyl-CoA hydratase n=1 Tax=Gordonia sp. CPCC 205515 TaxID=3140791 RepID=UPI003AF3699A